MHNLKISRTGKVPPRLDAKRITCICYQLGKVHLHVSRFGCCASKTMEEMEPWRISVWSVWVSEGNGIFTQSRCLFPGGEKPKRWSPKALNDFGNLAEMLIEPVKTGLPFQSNTCSLSVTDQSDIIGNVLESSCTLSAFRFNASLAFSNIFQRQSLILFKLARSYRRFKMHFFRWHHISCLASLWSLCPFIHNLPASECR